ncbi:MAG: helix-turn-helix transcriptional regulator [Eubacteriales bacterium]|nr:helix-turn-helix transcriptional regulator [Eubacteriales bacterium]
MELNQKLQELRKQKGLTQEELAKALFVSRTAVSKWESGRGYPSIDSLKALADFFCVSVDELLSGKELLAAAQDDSRQKLRHVHDIVFGLLDCAATLLLFLPLFGQQMGGFIGSVSLLELAQSAWYTKGSYLAVITATLLCGIATLALQGCPARLWQKGTRTLSLSLSVCGCLLFMLSLQPYAAMFTFFFLLIKVVLLLKRP